MSAKNRPTDYNCYEAADPDEEMFILLARDRHASALVYLWALLREVEGEDPAKTREARACAVRMAQQAVARGKVPLPFGDVVVLAVEELARWASLVHRPGKEPPDDPQGNFGRRNPPGSKRPPESRSVKEKAQPSQDEANLTQISSSFQKAAEIEAKTPITAGGSPPLSYFKMPETTKHDEGLVSELSERTLRLQALHLGILAKEFMAQEGLQPYQIELVESVHENEVRWFYRKREGGSMSIDAVVTRVYRDSKTAGFLGLANRPAKPGANPGIAGQVQLTFNESPRCILDLEGKEVWGGADTLMLGTVQIAKRIGYTRIEFARPEIIEQAIQAYQELKS